METYEKYLKETEREKYLDKLGVDALKPRIDNNIKELKDILGYMEVSTDAHLYSKRFKNKPKFQKEKGGNIFPYI